nr:hypothetical protein [Candidatus Sigynarchaeota archaeon]
MTRQEDDARTLIAAFKRLESPDSPLVDKIMALLGISGLVELGFALNKHNKRERDAAMGIVERYITALLSAPDEAARLKAKRELDSFFYDVPMIDEDA